MIGPNPSGLCMCGCGESTPIALWSNRNYGYVKDQPKRYVSGHARRKSALEYVVEPDTGCWIWQRGRSDAGYGTVKRAGRSLLAHRVFYERVHGLIPESLTLDHLCRNRACVNPDHLEPVTLAENIRRGLATKLTADQVRKIRLLQGTGTCSAIGHRFGVSRSNIHLIWARKRWIDLPDHEQASA